MLTRATGKDAELRETVPVTRRPGAGRRVVMSLRLPRLRRHDRIRVAGEVGTSTTCVTESRRCIGELYRFDPRISARIVLARKATSTSTRATQPATPRSWLRCGQDRPNRNHHCPIVMEGGGITVRRPGRLPCPPRHCRLNLVLSAHHRSADGGEVVVVGGDRPDGSVDGDKGRVSAVVVRASRHQLRVHDYVSRLRRRTELEPEFLGGHRVVYSQKLGHLRRGDVLIARARQRSALPGRSPYFISNQLIVSSQRYATRPTPLTKRSISGGGFVTQSNGFNCTDGPSAFRSPCTSRKSGIVRVTRTLRRPVYVNLISRTFPLIAQQARRLPAPVRILPGGGIAVQRLRVGHRRPHGPPPSGPRKPPSSGQQPWLPLPPLPIIGPHR